MRNFTWLTLLASASLVACVAPTGGDDTIGDDGDDVGDDGGDDDVDPPPPPPPQPAIAYHLTSDLDLSASTIVPPTVYEAIEVLRTFEDSPGTAILDLAEMAGVPAIDTIRDALPDFLESRLIGWIDGQLEDTQLAAVVHQIVTLADTAFGEVELGSNLDLTADVHTLETVAVEVAGQRAELPALPPSNGVLATSADVEITTSGANLSVGEHSFGLKIGTAAWQALNQAVEAQYGQDIAGVVATTLDCPGLAEAISNKCYFGQCVGHEQDLLDACLGAVDYAVGKLEEQFTAVDFEAVMLHAGTATGTDGDANGTYEALTGTWTAELDLGQGPRSVPATFTGTAE
jgi:hypothetical protein